MKSKNLILILLCILMSSIAFGYNGDTATNYVSSPFYNLDYNENTTTDTVSAIGQDAKPLICNLDGGSKELITFEGSTLYVYNIDSNGLNLISNINIGNSIKAISCTYDPFDTSRSNEQILVATETQVKGYGLSGATISLIDTYYTFPYGNLTSANTEFYCNNQDYPTSNLSDFACAIGNGATIHILFSGTIPFTGFDSFSFNQSHDTASNLVYDFYDNTVIVGLSTNIYECDIYNKRAELGGVSCSSIYTDTTPGSSIIRSIQGFYDIGEFDTYVCGVYADSGSNNDIEVVCFNKANKLFNYVFDGSTGDTSSYYNTVFYDLNIDGTADVCFNFAGGSGFSATLITRCYEMDGTSLLSGYLNNHLLGIGNIKEIDDPYLLFHNINNTMYFVSYENSSNVVVSEDNFEYKLVLEKLTTSSDSFGQIIGESASGLLAYFNQPSLTDTITLLYPSSIGFYGLSGFYDPTCVGTEFDYVAKECIGNNVECTYTNDNDNIYVREKLCTNCAGETDYHCGDWSYTEPRVNCSFDSVGDKVVSIDMYSDTNPSTIAYTFAELSHSVASSNCDLAEDFIDYQTGTPTNDTGGETPTEDETETLINALLDNIFVLGALLITLALTIGMAYEGVTHPLILGTVILGCMLFFTIIGWVPLTYMILLLVAVSSLAIISAFFFRGGN